jgi:hypothetical protein
MQEEKIIKKQFHLKRKRITIINLLTYSINESQLLTY